MNQINNLLSTLHSNLTEYLKDTDKGFIDRKLELFLHSLEKTRYEIYEQIYYPNQFEQYNYIHTVNDEYRANVKNNVLSIYIPEKLPTLKNRSSYTNKQIILNIAAVTNSYEKLFYDKFVIVIVKIFDKRKGWDVDNRTIKPIQDGLINGGVIKDDNLFNCCYMVQGFYSEIPHIEVSVLEASEILNFIDDKLPNFDK